jgi:hypothetical protein
MYFDPEVPLNAEFKQKCVTACTLKDFYGIVEYFARFYSSYELSDNIDRVLDALRPTYALKDIYNYFIGWALPSREVIQKLYEVFEEHSERYPDANFVDFGAGTGVFCHCMQLAGIPRDRIIAFDLAQPTHAIPSQRKFYPITTDYTVKETDFVFIGWGCGLRIPHAKTICILGEMDGCTTSSGHFRNYDDYNMVTTNTIDGVTWNITLMKAIGPASPNDEYLSINTCWQD